MGKTKMTSKTARGRHKRAETFLDAIWLAIGGEPDALARVAFAGEGDLPSVFAVSDLAAASIGAAGLALAAFAGLSRPRPPAVIVDRRLAAHWFARSLKPEGWSMPPIWDSIADDYAAADGWIRLHTNVPLHRAAALAVLGVPADRDAVRAAVRRWRADDLEAAIHARGGCAAAMRSQAAWAAHPQGKAVAAEPLVWDMAATMADRRERLCNPARPLAGVRVLDLTRIIAGPVATRFLAGFGAEVLRIDPPEWNEPSLEPELTLGKTCARLDLKNSDGRRRLLALLAEADIVVHGYRPGALERCGLGEQVRHDIAPGIIDVSLDAYGWTGPWAGRRGFDSLVQMSAGIADAGMQRLRRDRPTPLPVQALDHATGHIMAAAAIRGLTRRRLNGVGSTMRASLARTAALLAGVAPADAVRPLGDPGPADYAEDIEQTPWGPARRLRPPLTVEGVAMRWDKPATRLGSSPPQW
jgi:hypothetical protein